MWLWLVRYRNIIGEEFHQFIAYNFKNNVRCKGCPKLRLYSEKNYCILFIQTFTQLLIKITGLHLLSNYKFIKKLLLIAPARRRKATLTIAPQVYTRNTPVYVSMHQNGKLNQLFCYDADETGEINNSLHLSA